MEKKIQYLIDEIESEYKITSSFTGKRAISPAVRSALLTIPRDEFVPEDYMESAYYNLPLPIGHGQTISQPYIVAIMTDLLELESDHVVLEIGTGSGYQAAVLSLLCKQVYTIEIVPALARMAKSRLKQLGYRNIESKKGNGYHGWPEHAPFDAIIATAAAKNIPEPLIEQLKTGGRMVIPIGPPHLPQELLLIKKDKSGELDISELLSVAFVPFLGERDE